LTDGSLRSELRGWNFLNFAANVLCNKVAKENTTTRAGES
jgi:hypothetical protein